MELSINKECITMNKRSKIIAICLSALLAVGAVSPVFADETQVLTLESMNEMALKSNTSMKILNIQLEREKSEYVSATAISKSLATNFDIDDAFTYNDKLNLELTPLTKEKDYLDKMYDVLKMENEIDYNVKKMYFEYLNLKEDLQSKKEYYDFMDSKSSAKATELEVGQITQLAYDEFQKSYKQSFIDYVKAVNAEESKTREINVYLGQDPTKDIEIAITEMPEIKLGDLNLDTLTEKVENNSYQVDALIKSMDIKEKEIFLKQRFKGFGDKAIEMALAEDEVVELESKISDMKRTLKFDLYSKYNDALVAIEDITLKQLEYDLAERSYEIDRLKYENGLISLIDLTESRRNYEDSQYGINSAKLSYYLIVENFNNFVSENTTVLDVE